MRLTRKIFSHGSSSVVLNFRSSGSVHTRRAFLQDFLYSTNLSSKVKGHLSSAFLLRSDRSAALPSFLGSVSLSLSRGLTNCLQ